MVDLTFGVAFLGGLLSFFSPCVLPLIPGYLAHISGTSLKELQSYSRVRSLQKVRSAVFLNSALFTSAFSSVFIVLGLVLAGVFGALGPDSQVWLARIGGSVIIIAGLHMLGLLQIPFLARERSISSLIQRRGYLGSAALGASFGLGWTPCFGPILASILVLAGTSGSAVIGGSLLATYSLGLAVPFLLTGLFTDKMSVFILKNKSRFKWLPYVSGIFLIILGVIVFTNSFARLLAVLPTLGGVG